MDLSTNNDDVIVGLLRQIRLMDVNGAAQDVYNLEPWQHIQFFVALSTYGKSVMESSIVHEGLYQLHCAWHDDMRNAWSTSGLVLEPLPLYINGSVGYMCTTDHLTSFTLILRRTDCLSCRSQTQMVCTAIACMITFIALVQTLRVLCVWKMCTRLVMVHLAIAGASFILAFVAYMFPILAPLYPGTLIILSDIVTLIELGCYLMLMHFWIAPVLAGNNHEALYRLTCAFLVAYGFTAVGIGMIPVIILTADHDGKMTWARGGSYFMGTVMGLVFLLLGWAGWRLYRQLHAVKSTRGNSSSHGGSDSGSAKKRRWCERHCSLPERVLFGSVFLCSSILTQSILWIISIRESILSSAIMSDAIELGFNLACFATFGTLLFLFFFGVQNATSSVANNRPSTSSFMSTELTDASSSHAHQSGSSGSVRPSLGRRATRHNSNVEAMQRESAAAGGVLGHAYRMSAEHIPSECCVGHGDLKEEDDGSADSKMSKLHTNTYDAQESTAGTDLSLFQTDGNTPHQSHSDIELLPMSPCLRDEIGLEEKKVCVDVVETCG